MQITAQRAVEKIRDYLALSWDELESIVDSLGYELRIHPEMVKKIAV